MRHDIRKGCVLVGLFCSVVALGCASDNAAPGPGNTGGATSGAGGATSGSGGATSGAGGATSGVGGATSGAGGATSGSGGATSGDSGSVQSRFPDTSGTIAILADQFPTMSSQQIAFAASHYVGTEKQVLSVTQALRAQNPAFVVLHYHLAMWQSAPATNFIVDGKTWSNDYPEVTKNEAYFWHNTANQRVASTSDQKLLMNVGDQGFRDYWAVSIAAQIAAGEYDGVFLDSASPALLQGEASATDSRLARTAVKDTAFAELGNRTWIAAWESWISSLESALSAKGYALIPNTGAFTTTWDNTNYGISAGIFSEGFADPSFATADWKQSTNQLLALSRAGKIMILQNYLSSVDDTAHRIYYLANYLLVRGSRTYLDYFASGPLEWYPEWDLDLGTAQQGPAANVDALLSNGAYRRDFAKGVVFVNPTDAPATILLGATMRRLVPSGGGPVGADGTVTGTVSRTEVTQITVAARSAEILER
jgi:hypothetical protein